MGLGFRVAEAEGCAGPLVVNPNLSVQTPAARVLR